MKKAISEWVRNHERLHILATKILGSYLHFYSFHDSFILAVDWANKLPQKYDCVVVIPRSGLAIGQIISQKHGVPLSTPESFIRGEYWQSRDSGTKEIKSILLVEDSVNSGRTMKDYQKLIAASNPNLKIATASLFASENSKKWIDHYYIELHKTTIFEWNLLSAGYQAGPLASDLDGVLCEDCPKELDDDGEKYVEWMRTVKPQLIPNFTIEAIITARLSKYRSNTEAWLKQQGVKYNQLIMLELPFAKDRSIKKVVSYKSRALTNCGATWFWESNLFEASKIHKLTGFPVLNVNRMKLHN